MSNMAVGQNLRPTVPFWGWLPQGSPFERLRWDVHRGTRVLPHCHIIVLCIDFWRLAFGLTGSLGWSLGVQRRGLFSFCVDFVVIDKS